MVLRIPVFIYLGDKDNNNFIYLRNRGREPEMVCQSRRGTITSHKPTGLILGNIWDPPKVRIAYISTCITTKGFLLNPQLFLAQSSLQGSSALPALALPSSSVGHGLVLLQSHPNLGSRSLPREPQPFLSPSFSFYLFIFYIFY